MYIYIYTYVGCGRSAKRESAGPGILSQTALGERRPQGYIHIYVYIYIYRERERDI